MLSNKSIISISRAKKIIKSIIAFTPRIIIKVFKNRIFICIFTLAIGGLIGNRFDQFFINVFNWTFSKKEYYNILLLFLFAFIIAFLWLLIAYIRLHDMSMYKNQNTENIKICYSSDEFYSELTELVTNSEYKNDLFISIGEGESLNDWIIRICQEAKSGRIKTPQIRNINIKMLSDEKCKQLEDAMCISKGYSYRMKNNVNKFIKNPILKEYGIDINISYWDNLPKYHGFIYGRHCFVNTWEINRSGFFHVRTPLKKFTAEQNPEKYNSMLGEFRIK